MLFSAVSELPFFGFSLVHFFFRLTNWHRCFSVTYFFILFSFNFLIVFTRLNSISFFHNKDQIRLDYMFVVTFGQPLYTAVVEQRCVLCYRLVLSWQKQPSVLHCHLADRCFCTIWRKPISCRWPSGAGMCIWSSQNCCGQAHSDTCMYLYYIWGTAIQLLITDILWKACPFSFSHVCARWACLRHSGFTMIPNPKPV